MNRLVRPIMFAFEPDVVFQFSRVVFGTAGAPTLDTNNSKGVCNFSQNVISITGNTASSTTVSVVSSFAGIYQGMSISGSGIPANTTIASYNAAAGTITLSQAATATATGVALSVSGGQYTVTFGAQFTPIKRLDTYVKLLDIDATFDVSNVQGGTSTAPQAPAAPSFFLIGNNVKNNTLANLIVQFGNYSGGTFTAGNPASGEVLELAVCLCRSTAI